MSDIDRKVFLRSVLDSSVSLLFEIYGDPLYSLRELRHLPDSTIKALRPAMSRDLELSVTTEKTLIRIGDRSVALFDRDSLDEAAFNEFNGRNAIGDIADSIALRYGQDSKQVFGRVKKLFLRLVDLGICMPANTAMDRNHGDAE